MKFYLVLFIVVSLVACNSKGSGNSNGILAVALLGKNSSVSAEQTTTPATPTDSSNNTTVTSQGSPVVAIEPPVPQSEQTAIIPIQSTTPIIPNPALSATVPFDFTISSSFPDEYFRFGFNKGVGFQKNYPPEGVWSRVISVTLMSGELWSDYSNVDCATLGPLPDNASSNQFINSVSIWKKNPDGSFNYFSNVTLECSNSKNYTFLNIYPKTLSRYRHWFYTSLDDINAMWFEPNATYRILVSSDITDRKGRKLGKTNSLGEVNGITGKYFGIEFNTASRPNYKSFFDTYDDDEQFPYRIGYGQLAAGTTGDYSNCLEVIGTDFHNKTKTEIHSMIPELKNITPWVGSEWGGGCLWKMPTYNNVTIEYTQPKVLGSCILNPGKSNEYRVTYANGFQFNSEYLSRDCRCKSGIWRNNSRSLTNTFFEQTRYSENALLESPAPVCRDGLAR